jgi:metallo-beta-lactamase family protein
MTSSPPVPLLHFLGAAGTVTGSRFLIETQGARILVDCGLFQGLKPLRLRNWAEFPVEPKTIDAVVLTHAHVDHSGYLPALVRNGFSGPIFATPGTEALCRIVLPDSGHLQEEDASYANRKGFSKHSPALPLYTEEDSWNALALFTAREFGERFEAAPGITVELRRAGHILGAASALLELETGGAARRRLLVSGDLGRPRHPILCAPDPPAEADVVLVESTYGDRRHPPLDTDGVFEQAIVRTAARGGRVVIPAFAVDRTEVILLALRDLMRAGRIPTLTVYVDSPMALAALALYRDAIGRGSAEIRPGFAGDGDPFDTGRLVEVRSVAESKATLDDRAPCIVISAAGMATGGRVLHHLAHALPDARNTVLLPGYQAEGTRGRLLADGARSLKMHGRYVPVRADVIPVPAFSVHADSGELVDWLRAAPRAPEVTYVVHGEAEASAALELAIESALGWTATVPRDGERVRLD